MKNIINLKGHRMGHDAKKTVANACTDQSVQISSSVVVDESCSYAAIGNTGTLDITFDGDGIVVYDSSTGDGECTSHVPDVGKAMALDGAGNIYVSGFSGSAGCGRDVVICKFGSDGTLDSTFGGDGIVKQQSIGLYDKGKAIALDNAGNIYVTGDTVDREIWNMIILKYSRNGTLDTTFDGDGIVVYDVGNENSGEAIAVDDTENVYVAGFRNDGRVIWKYGSNGILDTTFDDNGMGVPSGHGYAIALEGTENVYVAGSKSDDMAIWKYGSDGKLDSTFGGGGVVSHGIGPYNKGAAIALDDTGNIYVAGSSADSINYAEGSSSDMVIWKYGSDGTLDSTFGRGGVVSHRIGPYNKGEAIALDDAGNIYVAGSSTNTEGNKDMVIWKYRSDGTLDTTFDGDGLVVHNGAAGGNGNDFGNAIALDSTGRVYVAGSSINAKGNEDIVIWKYK